MSSIPSTPTPQIMLLFLQLALILATSLVLGRVARRFKQPVVVAELLVGVLLGPSVLGHAFPAASSWLWPVRTGQTHLIDAVAQVGVILLVAITGTEIDVPMMRRRRVTVLWISGCALAVPLALGVAAASVAPAALLGPAGGRGVFALFIGVAMCVTAIPVIAKTLADMNLLHRDVGQLTLASAAVDDSVGWLLLSLVSAVAIGRGPRTVVVAVSGLAGVVVLAVLAGRVLAAWTRRAPERAARLATTPAIVLILLAASGTAALGLEPILGAFVVGVLLASDLGRRAMAPARTVVLSVLTPIFLATAGLRVDFRLLGRPLVLGAAVAAILVASAGKIAGAYAGARLARLSHWEGLALGSAMNARGVVEVVVASVGLSVGVLTTSTYTVIVLMAIVSSMLAPPLLRFTMQRVGQGAEEQLRRADHETHWSIQEDADARPGIDED